MGIKLRRLLALNIDVSIIIVVLSWTLDLAQRIINFIFFNEFSNDLNFDFGLHLISYFMMIILYLYSMFFIFIRKDLLFKNASLGKKICGLEIVYENNTPVIDKKILIDRVLESINLFPLYLIHVLTDNIALGDEKYKTKVIKRKK